MVRAGVDSGSGTVEDCLGDGLAAEVAAIRTGITKQLQTLLVARSRSVDPGVRITVHGSSDPWATGSFSTLQPAVGDGINGVVASCWDPAAGIDSIRNLRAMADPGSEVGAYLRLDRRWPAGEMTDRRLQQYLTAGMGELPSITWACLVNKA